jgi:hypothetical protein
MLPKDKFKYVSLFKVHIVDVPLSVVCSAFTYLTPQTVSLFAASHPHSALIRPALCGSLTPPAIPSAHLLLFI